MRTVRWREMSVMFLSFVRILYTTGPFVGEEHTARAGCHSSHPTTSVGQGDYSEGFLFGQKHGGPRRQARDKHRHLEAGMKQRQHNAAPRGARSASANCLILGHHAGVVCRGATHQWHNATRTS